MKMFNVLRGRFEANVLRNEGLSLPLVLLLGVMVQGSYFLEAI